MCLWKFFFFLSCSPYLSRCVSRLSLPLPWVSLCDSFSTDILSPPSPPSLSPLSRSLFLTPAVPQPACQVWKKHSRRKEWNPVAWSYTDTQIMVGRRSSLPLPDQGLWWSVGSKHNQPGVFTGPWKCKTLILGGCGPDLMKKEEFVG